VDYEITLAGNFGEPRPHHFHGGLDVKTEGREGKHIYAIADGYVSRITVGKDGFGNAIYITHPTGQTSVYCHLKSFSPRIKAALRRYQYKHETCEADARLTPLDVPVSAG
jgi:murein DD-endopeptidase MepM/ murein hydrolase activator NlpD